MKDLFALAFLEGGSGRDTPRELREYLKLEVRSQDPLRMSTMKFAQVPFQMTQVRVVTMGSSHLSSPACGPPFLSPSLHTWLWLSTSIPKVNRPF